MKKKQEIPIRPALTLPEKIQIISNSYMPNKDKIDCIMVLVESEIAEKDICLNWPKIRQQLMSEILYLFQKIEKDQALRHNKGYIYKRISLGWQNCRENGWLIPRDFQERKCDYLANLQKKQAVMCEILTKKKKAEEKKKEKKKKRNTGWHKKTWDRYNKFYLGVTSKSKKKPAREKQGRLPIN
jgi:hypothetical protein